jgi:hypothetical protein
VQSAPVKRIGISTLWGFHLCLFPSHRLTSSHVSQKSLTRSHAVCVPDTAWTGHRLLPDSSRERNPSPDFGISLWVSIRQRRFICIHLYESYLTDHVRLFLNVHDQSLSNRSRLRQFVISSYQPIPRGLPSSLLKHGYFTTEVSFVTQGSPPTPFHRPSCRAQVARDARWRRTARLP